MNRARSRNALLFGIAALALGGCGGAALPGGTSGIAPQRASWMLPDAAGGKSVLLYVGDSNGSTVSVYDYASGALVGKLTGFNSPAGGCVDARGDVFITNEGNGKTLEFANGGTEPIHVYRTGPSGIGCSVDRKGDLAVVAQPIASGPAKLCVWKGGKGRVACYTDQECGTMQSPGYDPQGNLYVEGFYFGTAICELPSGGSALKTVNLNGEALNVGGGVMWDGKHLMLTDWQNATNLRNTLLYRVSEAPSGDLTVIGTTTLGDTCNGGSTQVTQPFVVGTKNTPVNDREGQTVLGANYECYPAPVDAWRYPRGGNPDHVWPAKFFPGGAVVSIGSAGASADRDSSNYRVIYNFHGRDGARPVANLIAVDGVLYGTTTEGGLRGLAPKDGVVFSLTPAGTERVLHNFGATRNDGTYPMGALLDIHGTLYGTTGLGNPSNTGTVYSITPGGDERVIYAFGELGPSGMQPSSNLIAVNGLLYSTTNFGGSSDLGTVFALTTGGTEQTLHSFGRPYLSDGEHPAARLLELDGALYGTTYEGGVYGRTRRCNGSICPGDGTAFAITLAGKVRILHSFGNGSDGLTPAAPLIQVDGMLYGTTAQGGAYGCGTVFSLSTGGRERVLYSFGSAANDGCEPDAGLIAIGTTLFGTTGYGGAYDKGGTVFSLATDGSNERILHSFGSGSDGKNPVAALHELDGVLYGTTENGGTGGHGTVFAVNP
jgi:uncharacterized repeat protein (TIGR03803 family)